MNESSDRIQCANCGATNFKSAETCWQCGQPLASQQDQSQQTPQIIPPDQQPEPGQPSPYPPPASGSDTSIYIILGFIFAVFGFFCCPISLVGIVMGAIAYSKGNKLGIWVIAASVITLILNVAAIIAYFSYVTKMTGGSPFPAPSPSPIPGPSPIIPPK
ncbi:MAG: hypothetical protein ACYC27_09840 [Armatimonadota bacterium]